MKTKITVADINVTFKQEGYGRQGLYVNGNHLMSVFPNFEEHFGITHTDNAFGKQDEQGNEIVGEYIDESGNETEIYESKEKFMIEKYHAEIEQLLEEEEN
tara:strand:- start:2295 stop:2597 length:303 start_codon:yes stop_codon:yes gene_type:complete